MVADIAFDQPDAVAAQCQGKIVAPAAHHVVDDAHFRRTRGKKQLDNVRTHETGPTGNEAGRAGEHAGRIKIVHLLTRHGY
ncbi:hypothetical protein GCM10011320_29080 [Neoroseomonas lacus]|uniref:Uncharacterized protein n=1 Tax=Neoroseomonas lacus TaxID=287609 RepID=A0A917KLZ4_9PROT|nr:hypothetical protein GCM10011320_29080 [Neoroseomonas lacus]